MDDILNIAQSAMRVTEPLPGKIPLLFQLLDRTADRIHPIFTNMGQALSRIVPIIRQGQHQRQQPLCLQRQRHIPKMVIGHDRKIFCLFNSEHCHLTSSFLASLYTEQQLQISVFMVVIQIAIVYLGMVL